MLGRQRTKRNRILGIVCGAFARSTGQPCQCKLLLRGGKCKFHGCMNTGPKTPEGRKHSLQALIDYAAKRRTKQSG
jgi:hypothetical protein